MSLGMDSLGLEKRWCNVQSRSHAASNGTRMTHTFTASTQSTTYITAPVNQKHFSVTNAGVTNGDRKKPNPIEFSANTAGWYVGTISTRNPANKSGTDVSGPLPYTCSNSPFSISGPDSNLYNRALSRLYDRLRREIDLSITLAESRKTAQMVSKALRAIRYIRSFHPKKWGDRWLEYQYGWRPLLQDAYNSFDNLLNEKVKPTHVVVTAHESAIRRTSRQYVNDNQVTEVILSNGNRRVLLKTQWHIKPSILQGIGDWTSLNPVSIAWELLPYSFVVDWFFDLGGYLRNFESALLYGQAFKQGFATESSRLRHEYQLYGESTSGTAKTSYSARGFTADIWKKRTVLSSVPYPRIPRVEANLGSQRLLSAAALLSQHLGVRR